MSKLSYQRLDDILDMLVEQIGPIPMHRISKVLNVSERTVRSDINLLNEEIEEKSAKVIQVRGEGYYLETQEKTAFLKWWKTSLTSNELTLSSSSERQELLLFTLFKSQKSYLLDDFLDLLFVSKNTFYSYLKNIRDQLLPYGIKVTNRANIGFSVVGNEFWQRQAITDLLIERDLQSYLTGFNKMEKALFNNIDLDKLKQIEIEELAPLNLLESDYYHKNMLSHFALSLSRVFDGKAIRDFPVKIPKLRQHPQRIIKRFIQQIEIRFNISLPENEKKYFIYYLSINAPKLVETEKDQQQEDKVSKEITVELLENIKTTSTFDFLDDQILISDLSSHIKGFINMNSIDAGRTNPLLDTIKTSFPLAYDLCLTNLEKIGDKYGIYFSENEVGYIALHIAGALERKPTNKSRKYRVILVCGTGKAMSRIIEAKIKNIYQKNLVVIDRLSYLELQQTDLKNTDFIITTIPLESSTKPFVFIQTSQLDNDITKVGDQIERLNNRNSKVFNLFDYHFFFNNPQVANKQDLLQQMSAKLEKEEVVPDNFFQSVLEREKIEQTNIGNILAIPHPMKLIAKRSKVAVSIFPNGINWGDGQYVYFIFLFAITKQDYQETTDIYDLILSFLEEKKAQKRVLEDAHFETFLKEFHSLEAK